MPRPKQYEDDATRAAAWRLRQQRQHLQDAEIARLAQRLHDSLQKAADMGDPEAASLLGAKLSETLRNLQHHFLNRP